MIKNYFKLAWRNLWKNRVLSVIKITGLGIGLTVCLLIFLYSKDEISFDRFHTNKENIYRIIQDMHVGKETPHKLSITLASIGESFRDEIPEVKERVRLRGMPVTIKKGNEVFAETPLAVDNNFFSVFSFNLLQGNPQTVLKDKYSIVLTESFAKKYFNTTDVVGKTLQIKVREEFQNFTVTGVAAEPPLNSTITFTMLVPIDYRRKAKERWIGGDLNTFLVLDKHADINFVLKKMQAVFDKNTSATIKEAEKEQRLSIAIFMGLQPLEDIHLNKALGAVNGLTPANDPLYSYVLGSIAIFILLIACINFINLSVGQSLKRSREIGIRKLVGGNRRQLIVQFLIESFLVSLLAFALAIVLAIILLPLFNELAGKKLSIYYLADGWLYAGWFLLLLVTAFIAGFYPSLVMSGFQPLRVLSGRFKLMGKNYFGRGLVVFQFALTAFLIIGTITIYAQLNFLFHSNPGYDSSNLVNIELPFSDNNDRLIAQFKNDLSGKQGIVNITTRNRGYNGTSVWADGKQINIDFNNIDAGYFTTFKIPLLAGRGFQADFPGDTLHAAIVNETFAQRAGWQNGNAIGKTIKMVEDSATFTIVGIIKDYHYRSLKSKIEPQVFTLGPEKQFGQIWVKISPGNIPATLNLLSRTFQTLSPLFPYSYNFMDDINSRSYEMETKWKQIIGVSALIFIFISCIGLLGLVMLSVEQRTKEIGILKVLGAAAVRIFLLIAKEFTTLVLIAFLIAIPAGYYVVQSWLQDFPYRIVVHWWIFGLAGISILALALITISFQAIKAALANPVKSLRTE